ncbi:MAG: hypothetical protein AABW89_04695 [Nanoarchaeota archaeon]
MTYQTAHREIGVPEIRMPYPTRNGTFGEIISELDRSLTSCGNTIQWNIEKNENSRAASGNTIVVFDKALYVIDNPKRVRYSHRSLESALLDDSGNPRLDKGIRKVITLRSVFLDGKGITGKSKEELIRALTGLEDGLDMLERIGDSLGVETYVFAPMPSRKGFSYHVGIPLLLISNERLIINAG